MKNIKDLSQIVQKVRQAPWRVQRQWIGLILLGLVGAVMVAGIYVNVTNQSLITGALNQRLTNDIEAIKRSNADESAKLASLTSSAAMQERARELGFEPATWEDITFITVPGYTGDRAVDLSTETEPSKPSLIKPEYTETLFDWFTRLITTGVRP